MRINKERCFSCIHWDTKRLEIPLENGTAYENKPVCLKKRKVYDKRCSERTEIKLMEITKI